MKNLSNLVFVRFLIFCLLTPSLRLWLAMASLVRSLLDQAKLFCFPKLSIKFLILVFLTQFYLISLRTNQGKEKIRKKRVACSTIILSTLTVTHWYSSLDSVQATVRNSSSFSVFRVGGFKCTCVRSQLNLLPWSR